MTTTFNTATPYVDIRALEYSGLDPVNPFDVGTSASGTGTSANSGTVTTTAANALIFGAGITTGGFSTAGTNFTTRIITTPDADIAQDRIVTSAGAYSATAPVSGAWVMQVATFKAAAASSGDTTPPTVAVTAPTGTRLGHGDRHRQRHRQCRVWPGCSSWWITLRWAPRTPPRPTASSWNTTTVANGAHTLTALARDTSGNTATSAPVTVTVANATAAPPAFVQVKAATPQTNQSSVAVTYTGAQTAGKHQHRGHRLEQRDLEYHLGDRFGRQHLSTGGAHRAG